jgi:cytosine/adenosine deaminase-related metal-dependent hydrolase
VAELDPDSRGVLAPHARAGAAIHSVRAVPPAEMHPVVAWSHAYGAPLHAHLSEQAAENQACLAAYGATPAQVFEGAGALGPRSTMVHATHLSRQDIELLGASQACACLCPTTEAFLADGIGPAAALASAGCPLSLGSDSHAVIDLLDEARRVELGERLATGQRGWFGAAALARAATYNGHACLGWPEAGEIVPGAIADLVTLSLDTPRLAGARGAAGATGGSGATGGGGVGGAAGAVGGAVLESVIFAGTAADVTDVVVGGRDVVRGGRHLLLADVPAALTAAIRPLF